MKRMFWKALMSSRLLKAFSEFNRGGVVLVYHGVSARENIINPRIQSLHMPADLFDRQMRYFAKNFDVVTLADLIDHPASSRCLAITFDDGYENVLSTAAPIMKSYGCMATVFVPTGLIGTDVRLPTFLIRAAIFSARVNEIRMPFTKNEYVRLGQDREEVVAHLVSLYKRLGGREASCLLDEVRLLLSISEWAEVLERYDTDRLIGWAELGRLSDHGFGVGSHTSTHAILHAAQAVQDVKNEIVESRDTLLKQMGSCDYFAFPNGGAGDICSTAVQILKESGYAYAFTTIPGVCRAKSAVGAGRFLLPRLVVGHAPESAAGYVSTAWRHQRDYLARCRNIYFARE